MTHIPPLLDITPEHWTEQALCAELGAGMADEWFPRKGNNAHSVRQVCGRCPVATQCLTYALENNERHGIWGGVGERERRKMLRIQKAAEVAA